MRRAVTYGAIGGSSALLYLLVALILARGFAASPFWSSATGFAVALPFSYLGHKFLSFGSGARHRVELPRFVVAAGIGLVASAIVPEMAVRHWNWPPMAGYLAACVIVPAVNYLLLSLWVFVGIDNPARSDGRTISGAISAGTQKYMPYRSGLLTPTQLRPLHRLRPARIVRDTLLLWVQIIAAWAAVACWPSWWLCAAMVPVIGTRYYALYIIGHDGLHRRLFRDVRVNDLWNDLLIIGAIGAITRLNRANHLRHHATLALPHDPDRYKYIAGNKQTKPAYVLALTGLPYVLRAVENVFLATRRPSAASNDRYTARDIAILCGWQAGLIGGLSVEIGWWAYPVLWLLPIYVFTFAADTVRVFLEHSLPIGDVEADAKLRLVTYRSSAIERCFFAPMNMNFHTAHHLWPAIPYYQLPLADRLIRGSPSCDDRLVWRGSYLNYLLGYGRGQPWRSGRIEGGAAAERAGA